MPALLDYGWPVGLLAILGGHLCISKCKRMPKLDLLISGDILRSLFFARSAASHRRPKVDYRSESGEPTIGIIDEAASWGWLAFSLDYSPALPHLPGIYRVMPRLAVASTITREYFPLFCCVAFFCLSDSLHEGVACLSFLYRLYFILFCLPHRSICCPGFALCKL